MWYCLGAGLPQPSEYTPSLEAKRPGALMVYATVGHRSRRPERATSATVIHYSPAILSDPRYPPSACTITRKKYGSSKAWSTKDLL
jgi:hypothetical protein